MLFSEALHKFHNEIEGAIHELFDKAFENQTHEQDLLLIIENGFYNERDAENLIKLNLSPFTIGPGDEGLAEQTQFEFYNSYRHNYNSDRENFINASIPGSDELKLEQTSIQIEMMIYLKFWESDSIIKQLYELSLLARGEDYDWYFDTSTYKGRQDIIRNYIRDPLEIICPHFYTLVQETYFGQIRNAIAHSQFSILGRYIHLNNKHLENYYTIDVLSFEEWEVIIHKIIMFQNEMIRQKNKYFKIYSDKSKPMHYGLQIRMTDQEGNTKNDFYFYEENVDRWVFYKNRAK